MSDLVTLVNSQDEVIGQMDKIEAHRGQGTLHRAISVLLFCKHEGKQQLLIQQRSAHKIVGAHQWANTCCGNVRPDETYLECAHRRLREELGIHSVSLTPARKFQYQVQCSDEFSENEIDQVFLGRYDGKITPNPEEVAQVEWVSWDENDPVEVLSHKESSLWAPWFRFVLENGLDTLEVFE